MNLHLAPKHEHRLKLDELSFPEKLAEALGPRETHAPELNPVPRQEAVRFVNGLPRTTRTMTWFEPPPPSHHREAAIDRFLARVDPSDLPEAQQKLVDLLQARRSHRRGVRAALMQTGFSTREL